MNANNITHNNSNRNLIHRVLSKPILLALVIIASLGLLTLILAQAVVAHEVAEHGGSASLSELQQVDATATFLQVEVRAPSGHRVYTDAGRVEWNYQIVKEMDKCSDFEPRLDGIAPDPDFAAGASAITVQPFNNGRLTTPTPLNAHNIKADAHKYTDEDNQGVHGQYVCIEAQYYTGDEDSPDTISYEYLTTEVIDIKAPSLDKDSVRLAAGTRDKYTVADIGAHIDIEVTFDEPVNVAALDNKDYWPRITTDLPDWEGGHDVNYFELRGDRDATDYAVKSSNTLTFRMTVGYDIRDYRNEAGVLNIDEDSLQNISWASTTGGTTRGYQIQDMEGNVIDADTILFVGTKLVDNFEVEIDTSPIVSLRRSGQDLEAVVIPAGAEYLRSHAESGGNTKIVTSADGKYEFFSLEDEPDDCEDLAADSDKVTVAGADSSATRTLPDEADNKYYCVVLTERDPIQTARGDTDQTTRTLASVPGSGNPVSRVSYSNVYHYAVDETAPVIGAPEYLETEVVITVTDAGGAGLESLSWGTIRADSEACVNPTLFSFSRSVSASDGVIEIANSLVPPEGLDICVRAEDGDGNVTITAVSISHTPSETEEPVVVVDPETPDATDPDDMTDDESDQFEPGTVTEDEEEVFVGLPANWDQLSVADKIALNPYGCLDTTQIRADNGQCISGGSHFSDEQLANPGTSTPVTTDPADTTPAQPADPADDQPVEAGEDDDETETEATPPAAQITFTTADGVLNLSGNGTDGANLSNWMYVMADEGTDCAEAEDYKQVSDDGIDVSELADDMVVCVRASDEGAENAYIYKQYTASSAADSTSETSDEGETASEETEEESDEEGGGALVWIVVAVVAVILIVVIAVVASGKKDNNSL